MDSTETIGSACFVANAIISSIFIGCLSLFNNSDNTPTGLRLASSDKSTIASGCATLFNVPPNQSFLF